VRAAHNVAGEKGLIVYQHILLPVDGSPASMKAVERCIAFAAEIGARVTALHVVEPLHLFTYEFEVTEQVHDAFRRKLDARTHELLLPVQKLAREANVACDTLVAQADEPWLAIIDTARHQSCDLVVMGSHGKSGVRALLLGSQTQKVLTHSHIPVLVFR
jgi:nucleotide-binding universal stress UspA family protein